MEGWERRTCIKFKERTTETDYVMLYFGPGCQSDVGRVGGFQTTSLGEGCNDYGIITHELGHLIGLYHEQNRPDRNTYIDVLWDNIKPCKKVAFYFTEISD
ncbi:predicted protein [Nematostella vectensis]|uniref:Metalloendopeptidase n=1 Tax=Nematostella vectensis TaxID=45351 RepID=A7RET3_NEMVE|nr:predicted protein [Nematostella vectensis]|eukprot:XP_001642034.1 predicted protein [Nematostella vectensis]